MLGHLTISFAELSILSNVLLCDLFVFQEINAYLKLFTYALLEGIRRNVTTVQEGLLKNKV